MKYPFSFATVTACFLLWTAMLHAQDHTIAYSTTDPGVTRSITNWGVATLNYDEVKKTLIFTDTNLLKYVFVGFEANVPLTNNDITVAQKTASTNTANLAKMVPTTNWVMTFGSGSGVDAWYKPASDRVYPDRWAALMQAYQRSYNHSMWLTMPFNEPDWGWGQGNTTDLYDIMGYLKASPEYTNSLMGGGTVLDVGYANSWYDAISSRATVGTTHTLNGSVASYVDFINHVNATGGAPMNTEAHNVAETILGAQYGLKGANWWLGANRVRGEFANTCQGKQLAYVDDWARWTVATVYRATNGAVKAFLGAGERHATTTTYRLFSKDRDVFYDGDGPRRDLTVTVYGNQENVINITNGADMQPKIGGRYIIVNRNSSKVLEVPGASTTWGVQLTQNTYSGASNQLWDVNQVGGLDGSSYSLIAAHSGASADLVYNYFNPAASYDNGTAVLQYGTGGSDNEQWYFDYVGNGYFKIRSAHSKKVLGVNGASTASGATILQWDDNGTLDHEWRFVPVGATPADVTAPATVAGLSATASPRSVRLSWTASVASDLGGYTVLRSTTNGGPYEIVARGSTNNSFTDKSANQNKTYYYMVKAVDRSWNSSANSAQVSATPTSGPTVIARYPFDGNLSDSSTNANHPIVTNGSPTFVAGKNGLAMDLDGTSQSTMLPANMLANVTNFTIALWVNWDGGGNWQRLFDFGNGTGEYMFLTPSSGSGTLRFAISTNGGGAGQQLNAPALPTGQWRHVAVTRNGTTARLYTNGILAATNVITVAPASFNPALNYLGDSQYEADPLFNGRLDELFIYNYALSDAEIARLTNNVPPPPNVPTTLVASSAGSTLDLSWPANYLGCRLQVQTNTLAAGLGANWFDVAGSAATNAVTLPMDSGNGSVFYRLAYP